MTTSHVSSAPRVWNLKWLTLMLDMPNIHGYTWIHLDQVVNTSSCMAHRPNSLDGGWSSYHGEPTADLSLLKIQLLTCSSKIWVFEFSDSQTLLQGGPRAPLYDSKKSHHPSILYLFVFFAFTCISTIQNLCSIVRKWDHSLLVASPLRKLIMGAKHFQSLTTHPSASKDPTRWACKRRFPDKGHRMACIQQAVQWTNLNKNRTSE